MFIVFFVGMILEELILNGILKVIDLGSVGCYMFNYFVKLEWYIENIFFVIGMYDFYVVGVGCVMVYYGYKGVVIILYGEFVIFEGFVYEVINGVSNECFLVIFVFQDNGYGIFVFKKDQIVNCKVVDNFFGFKNFCIIYCNGKDVFDLMNVMIEVCEFVIVNCILVIVYVNCVCIGLYFNFDKYIFYCDENELVYVKEVDLLMKFCWMLLCYKCLIEEDF